MIAYYHCSKWKMNFTHHDFCFLIIITLQVEPRCLYQLQLGERISSACCQARWQIVLVNLLPHSYAIVQKVLIYLPAHLSSIFLSMASPYLHFHSLSLLHVRPQYNGGLFFLKIKTRLNWWNCQEYCIHCFLNWGGQCPLCVYICLGTSGQCHPFNIEQSDHHSFPSDTSHLLPANKKRKKENADLPH